MDFQIWPAVFAGIIGGLFMVLMRLIMKAAGVDLKMDIARLWGTMMKAHGTLGYGLGLIIHLIGSAGIGLIYAWGFQSLFHATDNLWLWGLVGGLIHWVIAGLFMGIVPAIHPEIPEKRPAPGPFVRNLGVPDVPTFLIGHVLYGLVVGILYALFHPAGGLGAAF